MSVTVDAAGAQMGGAARFASELYGYLARTGRKDVRVIGQGRHVNPSWLLQREIAKPVTARRIALNNVSFVSPGGERWALLRNALHFLTEEEAAKLDQSMRAATWREAIVVRFAVRRADVLVVPCTAMADRVARVLPSVRNRIVVRMHPLSVDAFPRPSRDPVIFCPVLFAPYKHMADRLNELLTAVEDSEASVRLRVTADLAEIPAILRRHPKIELVGRLSYAKSAEFWGYSRAIYFPTGIESFGYPLAEARASGRPVIARNTAQNHEIAGDALCAFTPGDTTSLREAVRFALTTEVAPDPSPFNPDAYFTWLLGEAR